MTPSTETKARVLRALVDSFVELPDDVSGPGCEPWHGPLLDGYVRACAAVLTDEPVIDTKLWRDVHEAFKGAVGAVDEQTEFENDPAGFLARHNLPTRDEYADVRSCQLQVEVDHWMGVLAGCRTLQQIAATA